MPILNARNNMFVIDIPSGFFYPSVRERWQPYVQKLKLPYQTVEDFINSSILSLSIPDITLPIVSQQQGQYQATYYGGKELEPIVNKSLSITFKLTESYLSYWIIFDQLEYYLKYANNEPCFLKPIFLTFLDNNGLALIKFKFNMITPTNLSNLELSYSKNVTDFTTFQLCLSYNRFEIIDTITNKIREF